MGARAPVYGGYDPLSQRWLVSPGHSEREKVRQAPENGAGSRHESSKGWKANKSLWHSLTKSSVKVLYTRIILRIVANGKDSYTSTWLKLRKGETTNKNKRCGYARPKWVRSIKRIKGIAQKERWKVPLTCRSLGTYGLILMAKWLKTCFRSLFGGLLFDLTSGRISLCYWSRGFLDVLPAMPGGLCSQAFPTRTFLRRYFGQFFAGQVASQWLDV